MKKGFFVSTLLLTSLVISPVGHAAVGCESGMKSNSAYAAVINFYPLAEYLMEAPEMVNRSNTQSELQAVIERVDSREQIIERLGREKAGCVSEKMNGILDRDVGGKYGFKSAEDMINRALNRAKEARSLYPVAQERIKQTSLKRQKEIADTKRQNEIAQARINKEQQEIEVLEEARRKQRELNEQLRAAEQKRKELEARQAQPSSQSESVSKYIAKPAGSESFSTGLNSTREGDGYIKKNRVICFSKSAHDRQIEMLVDGIKQFAPGCFSTPENQNAWMRDSSWGECVVQRVSDNKRIWTDCGDFVYW